MLWGTTHAIRLTPNSELIPETVSGFDNVFRMALLSDSKFSGWLLTAETSANIAVSDSGTEVSRYVDANFEPSTPNGTLWWAGDAEYGRSFLLEAGPRISRSNSSAVFDNHICAHGFYEPSGESIDRCGYRNITGSGQTYSVDAMLDLAMGHDAVSDKLFFAQNIAALNSVSQTTIHLLIKKVVVGEVGNRIWLRWGSGWTIATSGNVMTLSCAFSTFRATFDYSLVFTSDEFALLSIVFDGTQTDVDVDAQDAKRFRVYVNGVEQTLVFAVGHVPDSSADASAYECAYGLTNASFIGSIDEDRWSFASNFSAEVLLRYNQWIQNVVYWLVTVVPVIFRVSRTGPFTYAVHGTGLSISGNPTVIFGGVEANVNFATDTIIQFTVGAETPTGRKTCTVINEDGEHATWIYSGGRMNHRLRIC